jgi:hypothetical protein
MTKINLKNTTKYSVLIYWASDVITIYILYCNILLYEFRLILTLNDI